MSNSGSPSGVSTPVEDLEYVQVTAGDDPSAEPQAQSKPITSQITLPSGQVIDLPDGVTPEMLMKSLSALAVSRTEQSALLIKAEDGQESAPQDGSSNDDPAKGQERSKTPDSEAVSTPEAEIVTDDADENDGDAVDATATPEPVPETPMLRSPREEAAFQAVLAEKERSLKAAGKRLMELENSVDEMTTTTRIAKDRWTDLMDDEEQEMRAVAEALAEAAKTSASIVTAQAALKPAFIKAIFPVQGDDQDSLVDDAKAHNATVSKLEDQLATQLKTVEATRASLYQASARAKDGANKANSAKLKKDAQVPLLTAQAAIVASLEAELAQLRSQNTQK